MTAFSVGVAKIRHFRNTDPIQQPQQNRHSWLVGWWEDKEPGCYAVWSNSFKRYPVLSIKQTPYHMNTKQKLVYPKWIRTNCKTELLTFITVLFPPITHHQLRRPQTVFPPSLIGFISSFLSSPHLPSFLSCCFSYWAWCGDAPAWLASRLQTLWLRAGVGGLHHCLWGEATGMDWKEGGRTAKKEREWDMRRADEGEEAERVMMDDGDMARGSEEEVKRE